MVEFTLFRRKSSVFKELALFFLSILYNLYNPFASIAYPLVIEELWWHGSRRAISLIKIIMLMLIPVEIEFIN
ncbi:MAG: hypothetical protein QW534_11280 [Candidatus Methanomethylicia archaeon]